MSEVTDAVTTLCRHISHAREAGSLSRNDARILTESLAHIAAVVAAAEFLSRAPVPADMLLPWEREPEETARKGH